MPSTTNEAAAPIRTHFSGHALGQHVAEQHGRHVGQHHAERGAGGDRARFWKRAASATVAIWVLSPISTRKKAITVVEERAAARRGLRRLSSALSGISAQPAMAMNRPPTIQRIDLRPDIAADARRRPSAASAWLSSVATRMPRMIGTGLRIAGGQHHGEELGLVADLGDRHEACRDEEGFHRNDAAGSSAHTIGRARRPIPRVKRVQAKGLARLIAGTAKAPFVRNGPSLLTGPPLAEAGYSPMTARV